MDGLNLYLYTRNDPANAVDPIGAESFPYYRYGVPINKKAREAQDKLCHDLLEFLGCVGACVEANKWDPTKFLDYWGITQVGGNVVLAARVPEALGRTAHLSSWQHTLYAKIGERFGWNPAFRHFGKRVGRLGVKLLIAEGLYMLALEGYCMGVCQADPNAY